jgi:hypothetical protein
MCGDDARFVLQRTHLGTLAAADLATRTGFSMMRQDERSTRTIIVVMKNRPLRSGMILQIGMEGRNLRHLLLLRSMALPVFARSAKYSAPTFGTNLATQECISSDHRDRNAAQFYRCEPWVAVFRVHALASV